EWWFKLASANAWGAPSIAPTCYLTRVPASFSVAAKLRRPIMNVWFGGRVMAVVYVRLIRLLDELVHWLVGSITTHWHVLRLWLMANRSMRLCSLDHWSDKFLPTRYQQPFSIMRWNQVVLW